MNDKDQEREEIEMILPRGMRAKLEARAAKRGCTPETLIDEACGRIMTKAQLDALRMSAQAVADALMRAEPAPWPNSFDECIAVGFLA